MVIVSSVMFLASVGYAQVSTHHSRDLGSNAANAGQAIMESDIRGGKAMSGDKSLGQGFAGKIEQLVFNTSERAKFELGDLQRHYRGIRKTLKRAYPDFTKVTNLGKFFSNTKKYDLGFGDWNEVTTSSYLLEVNVGSDSYYYQIDEKNELWHMDHKGVFSSTIKMNVLDAQAAERAKQSLQ